MREWLQAIFSLKRPPPGQQTSWLAQHPILAVIVNVAIIAGVIWFVWNGLTH